MLTYGFAELNPESGPKLCMEEVLDRSYGLVREMGQKHRTLIR